MALAFTVTFSEFVSLVTVCMLTLFDKEPLVAKAGYEQVLGLLTIFRLPPFVRSLVHNLSSLNGRHI